MTYSFSLKTALIAALLSVPFTALAEGSYSGDPLVRHADGRVTIRDVATFEKTAFVFLRRQCRFCHGDTQAPLFAVANVESAYAVAKQLVDFNNVAKSKIVLRSQKTEQWPEGHCGVGYCITDGKEITQLVTEWAKSETNVEARVRTKAIAMPQLSMTAYTPIQWNLSELEPVQAGLENAKIQIEAIAFSADSILFRRPRIVGATKPVYVKDLALEINGEIVQKGKYQSIEKVVMPGMQPPVLSVDKILLPYASGMSIRLSMLRVAQSNPLVSCHDIERFQNQVLPVMVDRECHYCHGGGPKNYAGEATAMKTYDLRGNMMQQCLATMARSHPTTPLKSPIIWYALGNEAGHPRMIPYVDDIQPEWIDWIKTITWKARRNFETPVYYR